MKVLVNALPLRQGGGVTYLEQQLAAISRVSPDIELHNLVSPWGQIGPLPGAVETVRIRSVPTRFLYEQTRLPLRKFDLLYCPANFGPLLGRRPMVLTLHNAHYYRTGLKLKGTEHLRPWWKVKANHLAMRRADAVVAISNSQAEEAIASVPDIAHKLYVIHSASPDWPRTCVRRENLPDDYVLTVASSATHKRTVDVVAGWANFLDNTAWGLSLVVVGSTTPEQTKQLVRVAGRHRGLLKMIGPIFDRSQLRHVYENAQAFVSMSQLESFPLTPVEAASVGCPMVLSDIPAHREVSQGTALFVRPGDALGLSRKLDLLIGGNASGCHPAPWPVSWDDNARSLVRVFSSVSAALT